MKATLETDYLMDFWNRASRYADQSMKKFSAYSSQSTSP